MGAYVRNLAFCFVLPETSLPTIVTDWTSPLSSISTNSLNAMGLSRVWNDVEKFQMRTPTTTRTIQNNRLFSVEFNLGLP